MENKDPKSERQLSIMRWISFIVITLLFITSAIRSFFSGQETDKIIAGIFLIIVGFAWGANIWKAIINR